MTSPFSAATTTAYASISTDWIDDRGMLISVPCPLSKIRKARKLLQDIRHSLRLGRSDLLPVPGSGYILLWHDWQLCARSVDRIALYAIEGIPTVAR